MQAALVAAERLHGVKALLATRFMASEQLLISHDHLCRLEPRASSSGASDSKHTNVRREQRQLMTTVRVPFLRQAPVSVDWADALPLAELDDALPPAEPTSRIKFCFCCGFRSSEMDVALPPAAQTSKTKSFFVWEVLSENALNWRASNFSYM